MVTQNIIKLNPYLIPSTKINWKCIKDLNVRSESIKLLEESIGQRRQDTGFCSDFSDMTSKAKATKEKVDSTFNEKLKNFSVSKKYLEIIYLIKKWYPEYIWWYFKISLNDEKKIK